MSDHAGSSSRGGSGSRGREEEGAAEHPAAGPSSEWTHDEETSLQQALLQYSPHQYPTTLERCILIAAQLPTRSAREVALRISLLTSAHQPPPPGPPPPGPRPAAELKRRASAPAPAAAKPAPPPPPRQSSRNARNKQQQQQTPAPPPPPPPPPAVPPLLSLPALTSSTTPTPCLELQDIPPPGPTPLLPRLTAACLFPSPSTSNTSGEEATCLLHLPQATDHGTSGSAETSGSFGDPTPSLPTPHPPPDHPLLPSIQAFMEHNYAILDSFKTNMQQCRVGENTELLVRLRENLVACLSHMTSDALLGGGLSTMPPLPVHPNLELANKFLPAKLGMPGAGGMPPFPFNVAMGPLPGMPPLMFPPMMGPPPGMPLAPHMAPFPMPGMPPPPATGPELGGGMAPPPPAPALAQQLLPQPGAAAAAVKQEPS